MPQINSTASFPEEYAPKKTPSRAHLISSESLTLRRQPNAADVVVGGDVEGAAVVAEGAVGGVDAGVERAQMGAVGGEDQYAAGTGGEQVAVNIDLHAVGQSLL